MNIHLVTRNIKGEVTVKALSDDRMSTRDLNEDEMYALEGLLNDTEFEQQIQQDTFA
jgi:predicted hydrolase (HD superfamily)